jgi:hypothetical protein
MQADVDHLRLSIEREPDHWVLAVQNRSSGAWLYRSRATNLRLAQYVLLDFTSSELGRQIRDEDVMWLGARQDCSPRVQRTS